MNDLATIELEGSTVVLRPAQAGDIPPPSWRCRFYERLGFVASHQGMKLRL